MTDANLTILTNIIGAVESGGQIYGNRRYSAYAAPYKNNSNEVTITLGWAQNYGENARKLVKNIFNANKQKFRSIDDGSIEKILNVNWITNRFAPTTKQKNILISLITTEEGKQEQDKLFKEDLKKYLAKLEELYGKQSVEVQMMWCEIVHLGGYQPTQRIFDRAKKPLTEDTIYASLLLDQRDRTNNNQVGDEIYQSRHQCCVKWIKQYVKAEVNKVKYDANEMVKLAKSWEGKNEADGSFRSIIDIYNSMKSFPRGIKMQYDWAWCACFWSALAIKLGYTAIIPVEISCYYLIEKAQKMGIWTENDGHIPEVGDAVLYDWHDNGVGDNVGCPDHIGIVISVDKTNKTFKVMEGNYSNAVKQRTMQINGRYIRGFICPKYDARTVQTTNKTNNATNTSSVNKQTKIKEKPLYTMVCKYDSVAVRTYAGTNYRQLKSVPWLGVGNQVDYCDTVKATNGMDWYFVRIAYAGSHVFGFVRSDMLRRE